LGGVVFLPTSKPAIYLNRIKFYIHCNSHSISRFTTIYAYKSAVFLINIHKTLPGSHATFCVYTAMYNKQMLLPKLVMSLQMKTPPHTSVTGCYSPTDFSPSLHKSTHHPHCSTCSQNGHDSPLPWSTDPPRTGPHLLRSNNIRLTGLPDNELTCIQHTFVSQCACLLLDRYLGGVITYIVKVLEISTSK
jgi:hypothetical protein